MFGSKWLLSWYNFRVLTTYSKGNDYDNSDEITTAELIVVIHLLVYLAGLNDTCTAEADCSGVTNAECVGTGTKVCTCKANYKTESGLCNAAYGRWTLN